MKLSGKWATITTLQGISKIGEVFPDFMVPLRQILDEVLSMIESLILMGVLR